MNIKVNFSDDIGSYEGVILQPNSSNPVIRLYGRSVNTIQRLHNLYHYLIDKLFHLRIGLNSQSDDMQATLETNKGKLFPVVITDTSYEVFDNGYDCHIVLHCFHTSIPLLAHEVTDKEDKELGKKKVNWLPYTPKNLDL